MVPQQLSPKLSPPCRAPTRPRHAPLALHIHAVLLVPRGTRPEGKHHGADAHGRRQARAAPAALTALLAVAGRGRAARLLLAVHLRGGRAAQAWAHTQ